MDAQESGPGSPIEQQISNIELSIIGVAYEAEKNDQLSNIVQTGLFKRTSVLTTQEPDGMHRGLSVEYETLNEAISAAVGPNIANRVVGDDLVTEVRIWESNANATTREYIFRNGRLKIHSNGKRPRFIHPNPETISDINGILSKIKSIPTKS